MFGAELLVREEAMAGTLAIDGQGIRRVPRAIAVVFALGEKPLVLRNAAGSRIVPTRMILRGIER